MCCFCLFVFILQLGATTTSGSVSLKKVEDERKEEGEQRIIKLVGPQRHLWQRKREREREAEKGLSLQSLCVCPSDSGGVKSV